MRRCVACDKRFAAADPRCPACGTGPDMVDGFEAYAPQLAHGGGGFKAEYFADLKELEEQNFWFRGRNELLLWALEAYARGFESFLEIGCGTGYVLSGVSKQYPHARLHGSEIFTAGLRFAVERLPAVHFMQMDARKIPFYDEFDVIGAFDVLEHIEEDERVLAQMRQALKPGGTLLLTVPQHRWLWSASDEYACHVRRYTRAELDRKVLAAGFKVVRSTSFVSTLLPAMAVSRLFAAKRPLQKFDPVAELRISPVLNNTFLQLLHLERQIIRRGLNIPCGGSRLLIARKY